MKLPDNIIGLLNKIPSAQVFTLGFRSQSSNIGFVLALHRVLDISLAPQPSLNSFIEISDRKLEWIITELKSLGVKFVSLHELETLLSSGTKSRFPIVHISFDDGYHDNYSLAFPVLKKHAVPFSIFISSDFIDVKPAFLWWYLIEALILCKRDLVFEKYNRSFLYEDYHKSGNEQVFEACRNFMLEQLDSDPEYFRDKLFSAVSSLEGFNLPRMLSWSDLRIMQESGLLEVAIHSRSHARFSSLGYQQQLEEVKSCREAMISEGISVADYFAYPYGSLEDIGSLSQNRALHNKSEMKLSFTTIAAELNSNIDTARVPRIFLNNSANAYTLRSRLNGAYQRSVLKNK